MKTTILVLTALFLAAAPLKAQEEESSPSPAASPEMTPPEKSASDPSVSVTTEKTAAAKPKPESSPGASAKPASSAAKSSSESAPAKSTAPAAMPRKSTPEATLKDLENRWEASIPAHDISVAQALLADDFMGVSSKGKLLNKSALMAELKKDTDTYTSAKNGRMDVRVFGQQFGVVRGTSTEIGKDKEGKPFNRTFRWTDTWVDRNGKWQCIASQAVAVAK